MSNDSSRTRRFTRSLVSGYALMGTNILYTMATVPIALHYLSRAEFGLWALVTQLTGYITLIDLGMSGAIARTLVDHKDDRNGGSYGGIIQTGFLVNIAQGFLVVLAGLVCSLFAGAVLNVEPALQDTFRRLIVAQSILVGIGFALRPLSLMCTAHQRYDVVNNAQCVQMLAALGILWGGFQMHQGIFSLIWAYGIGQVIYLVLAGWGCLRLRLLPEKGHWGNATWPLFVDLFIFGKDVFLTVLGSQLINASQVILITRVLGLEAGALWSIATRVFVLLGQVVTRIFDFASGALAEMIVRNERALLLSRFRAVTIISTSLAGFLAVMFVACNQTFLALWTSGRISWTIWNDVLLGILLVLQVAMRTHTGLVGQTKVFGALRYLYFVEGVFFVGASLLVLPRWGITGMIGVSIVAICCFSLRHGFLRTCRYFNLPVREVVFEWAKPSLHMLLLLVPLALFSAAIFGDLPVGWKLMALAAVTGVPGLLLFLRLGLTGELKKEIRQRVPAKVKPAAVLVLS